MKPVLNIIIQLLWVTLCLFAGYEVSVNFFSTSSFLVRGLVTGTAAIIIYAVIAIITNIISATKDPDVKAASKFHLTVAQYRTFKTLFDLLLCDEMMSSKSIKEMLYDVIVQTPKEWKTYCLSRECEYKPFYHKGKEIFIRDKNNKYVKGVITNISFGIEWWYYTIEFTKPISINNGWPTEKATVLAKTIMDIEANDLKCDDTHYAF